MVDAIPRDDTVEGTPRDVVTSTGPRSNLSQGDISAPYQEFGKAFDKLSGALSDVAVPLAQRAAAEDLAQQKVTRDANGNVQLVNPANSVMFGAAGQAYERAVAEGTVAQTHDATSSLLTDIHAEHPLDPVAFRAAARKGLDTLYATAPTPVIRQAMQRDGEALLTQHGDAVVNAAAMNQVEQSKNSITSAIEDHKNTAIALARQPGGTDSPEFKDAVAKLNNSYDALGSNPLFKTPQDQIDLEKKNTAALLQGEAVVAHVDETFNKRSKGEAQQELEKNVLNNPNLSRVDRDRLYAQGMSRLAFLTGDAKATIDANRAITTEMESALAKGQIKAEDPAIGQAISRARSIGDIEGVQRLTAASQVQLHMRGLDGLSGGARAAALGISDSNRFAYNPATGRFDLPDGQGQGGRPGDTVPPPVYDAKGNPVAPQVDYKTRVAQIENPSGNPNATSVTGAKGKYQFVPGTWAKYGGGGDITGDQEAAMDRLTADNRADLTRTLGRQPSPAELYLAHQQGAGGASELLRNPTARAGDLVGDKAIRVNGGDPNASAAAFTNMWIKRFNGGGPVSAPSANGGSPFTQEQVNANPFLLSAYVRSLAADPEGRMEAIKGTAEAIKKSIDNGIVPPPDSVAMVVQAGENDPKRYGFIADDVKGRMAAAGDGANLSAPDRARYEAQVRAFADRGDIHHQAIANAALAQSKEQETQMRERPFDAGNARGWTPPAPPIDPAQSDAIAPALAQRFLLSQRIGSLNRTEPPSLLQKGDAPQLQAALQGQDGAKVLGSIAQTLRPEALQKLADDPAFRDSVIGMSRSGDPAKMNAAFKLMDQLQQQNPLTFNAQFKKEGEVDLAAWQHMLAFYPSDVAAKRIVAMHDPANAPAMEEVKKVADKQIENVSAANVVSKFSTGALGGLTFGLTGTVAQPPAGEMNGAAAEGLRKDYADAYRDGYAAMGDATAADKFAMAQLAQKYAVSAVNGNRVTAYAPERYYPEVGADRSWMMKQLDRDVGAAVQDQMSGKAGFEEMRVAALAPRALVPDPQTEADIAAHRPPSYQVVLQQKDGRFAAIAGADGKAMRFRFDPTRYENELRAGAEAKRTDLTNAVQPAAAGYGGGL